MDCDKAERVIINKRTRMLELELKRMKNIMGKLMVRYFLVKGTSRNMGHDEAEPEITDKRTVFVGICRYGNPGYITEGCSSSSTREKKCRQRTCKECRPC
jgi:hypothetical protein